MGVRMKPLIGILIVAASISPLNAQDIATNATAPIASVQRTLPIAAGARIRIRVGVRHFLANRPAGRRASGQCQVPGVRQVHCRCFPAVRAECCGHQRRKQFFSSERLSFWLPRRRSCRVSPRRVRRSRLSGRTMRAVSGACPVWRHPRILSRRRRWLGQPSRRLAACAYSRLEVGLPDIKSRRNGAP